MLSRLKSFEKPLESWCVVSGGGGVCVRVCVVGWLCVVVLCVGATPNHLKAEKLNTR